MPRDRKGDEAPGLGSAGLEGLKEEEAGSVSGSAAVLNRVFGSNRSCDIAESDIAKRARARGVVWEFELND